MLGSLGSPDRYDSVEHASAPSIDETSADHPNMILSCGLKASANHCPPSSKCDGLNTSVAITEPTANKTAHKSTKIVDRDNTTLQKSVVDNRSSSHRIRMSKFHGILIIVDGTIDTTHHALIISEKEDGQASDAIDGSEKTTLLQLVDDIGP